MDTIYLDYNCFQRSFDDASQIRIRMEALACQEVFRRAEIKRVRLVWSFMHQDETLMCPFPERKIEALRLALLCQERVGPSDEIYHLAKSFQLQANLLAKDALHLACAVQSKSKLFLTCDGRLIKQARRLSLPLRVMNPIEYIGLESEVNSGTDANVE
jgi:predicted nucleic acid-binding protein